MQDTKEYTVAITRTESKTIELKVNASSFEEAELIAEAKEGVGETPTVYGIVKVNPIRTHRGK